VAEQTGMPYRVAAHYAQQRFASSSYKQWMSIERCYSLYCTAYQETNPAPHDPLDPEPFLLMGHDFIVDLLVLLEVMTPMMDCMEAVQALACPVWKVFKWIPRITSGLRQMAQSICKRHVHNLSRFATNLSVLDGDVDANDPDERPHFKGVPLQPGWKVIPQLPVAHEKHQKPPTINWEERSISEALEESKTFTLQLADSLEARFLQCVSSPARILSECLELEDLLLLLEGQRTHKGVVIDRGALEEYGQEPFSKLYRFVCQLQHVRKAQDGDPTLQFDPRMAAVVYRRFKSTLHRLVWDSSWFETFLSCCALVSGEKLAVTSEEVRDIFYLYKYY
jgi:hypothetical protein